MLEAAGPEGKSATVAEQIQLPAFVSDFADAHDADAFDFIRQLRNVSRAGGEEQLEVFAAVEGEAERVFFVEARRPEGRVEGQERGFDRRPDAALRAEV
jgi:hypothetical protein